MISAKDGVTVIICCFNSAKRIADTIKHLALQKTDLKIPWEIIIVDNASTDDTVLIAQSEWQNYHTTCESFKIVKEPTQGLTFARHKGVSEAQFNLIIFCDDDNWLDSNYLQIAYQTISKHPKIGALGGQSSAISTTALPTWFENSKSDYAVGQQGSKTGDVTTREYLWGSGIVIKKSLYVAAFQNFPSILTGRKGKILAAGEDSEMCMRFIIMGYKLYYSEALKFQHFIAEERLTKTYNKKLQEGFYQAYNVLKIYTILRNLKAIGIQKKIQLFVKSILKLALFKPLIEEEKLYLYLIVDKKYQGMDPNLNQIKHFLKKANGYCS